MKAAFVSFFLLILVVHAVSDETTVDPVAAKVTCEALFRLKHCEDSICSVQCRQLYGSDLVKLECLSSYDCKCHFLC